MDARAEALAAAAAVDEARLWSRQMAMAEIGATERGGVNRAALSDEDRRARRLMVEWAGDLGFEGRDRRHREPLHPPPRPQSGCGARGNGKPPRQSAAGAASSTAPMA